MSYTRIRRALLILTPALLRIIAIILYFPRRRYYVSLSLRRETVILMPNRFRTHLATVIHIIHRRSFFRRN